MRRRRRSRRPGTRECPAACAARNVAPTGSPSSVRLTTYAGRYLSAQFSPVWPSSIGPMASARKIPSSRGGCPSTGAWTARARQQQHDEAGAVDDRHVRPEIERRAQAAPGDDVARGRRRADEREQVAVRARARSSSATPTSDRDSATTNAPAIAMAIPAHWPRVGGSRSHAGREQRDERRLHVHQHDGRGDGREADRRVPAPEMQAPASRRRARASAQLDAVEPPPLPPRPGGDRARPTMKISANPSRQIAMASGCACESRTSGPANEIPMRAKDEHERGRHARECIRRAPIASIRRRRRYLQWKYADETARVAPRILADVVENRAEIGRQLVQPVIQRRIVQQATPTAPGRSTAAS